jgi:hypothetical protein
MKIKIDWLIAQKLEICFFDIKSIELNFYGRKFIKTTFNPRIVIFLLLNWAQATRNHFFNEFGSGYEKLFFNDVGSG